MPIKNRNRRLLCLTAFIFTSAVFTGCSATGKITPVPIGDLKSTGISKGIAFSLPKTILEVKITYSIYNKKVWSADTDGNPIKINPTTGKSIEPKSSAKIVTVDKPIEITQKTIPDMKMTFAFDPESMSSFSKKTGITVELTEAGFLKTTNMTLEDRSKEIIKNFTETALDIARAVAVAGLDVEELVLIKDVVVTRHIDPADLEFKEDGHNYVAEYSDYSQAEQTFPDLAPPEIIIKIVSGFDLAENLNVSSTDLKVYGQSTTKITGLPYRTPGSLKVLVTVDGQQVYSNYHLFAQAGGIAFLPITSQAFVDLTQALQFSENYGSLTKYTSTTTSQGQALSETAKETTATLPQKIKELRTLEMQAKIDNLKKEKELIEAELALKKTIKLKEEFESNP